MKLNLVPGSACLLLVSWLMTPASGQEWPEFRGPEGQGHATAEDLPVEWSPSENVVWKTPLPGTGWSSPILHRGRLYLTAAVPEGEGEMSDHSLRVLAVDPRDGQVVWNVEVLRQQGESAPRIHRKNSHASPTPLARGERLYVHFGHQGTACLDLDGNVLWRQESIEYRPVHGNGGSPILVDNKLVFSVDGAEKTLLVALDAETGQPVWQFDRQSTATKKFSFSTPLAIDVQGRTLIVSPGSDMVCAVDARTGEQVWRVRYDGYSVIPRPVFGNGLVYVCTGYNRPSLLAIEPTGTGDVTESHVRWQTDKSVPHTPSLLLRGDELYMVSDRGVASCLDAVTGEVHWQERVDGNYSASPLLADGRIYLQNEEGKATVLAPGKTFEKLASNDLQERSLASYAVAPGSLFIRTEQHLYRIGK